MVTYRMADGSLVCGEYSFVTETEYFTECEGPDEPFDVIEERWELVTRRTVRYGELEADDE